MIRTYLLGIALALSVPIAASADRWAVVPDASSFGFISVKEGDIAEVHSFGRLTGAIDEGKAEVMIDLASVETHIDIRNERMREILFNIAETPMITVTAAIDVDGFSDLSIGSRRTLEIDFTIDTGAVSSDYFAEVNVTRVGPDAVSVASAQPIPVDASEFGYAEGIEKLREIAGLDSISIIVPVSFDLMLNRQ
ncbi:MAG: YceI family protein [Pseudomonadota bacterium]